MTTPPPYGSVPGQPQGYPSGPTPQQGYPAGATPPPAYGQQPSYGAQPAYGQPAYSQPGYAQPAYGQQPGYPAAPGYPPAGYGAPAMAARPGMVTAAAVLAFVFGGFAIIFSFGSLAVGSVVGAASDACNSGQLNDPNYNATCQTVSGYSGFFKVIAVVLAIVAILMIWGGVVALTGKNGQILVIGCAVFVVGTIVGLIAGGGFGGGFIVELVAPVLITIFMLNPASKAWFKSKGAKTF